METINNSNTNIIANKDHINNYNLQFERILKAALGYAELLSWPVFPLHSIVNGECTCNNYNSSCSEGKHPRLSNGLKSATTDLKRINEWFTKWPQSNIGVVTGEASQIFVLDVDGEEGKASLDDLFEKHGNLPDTVQSITGSGGEHYFFKYKQGIKNKTNFLPGLDIRGDGGYIVAPHSLHKSGKRYEWELSSRPIENEISEAPDWLLKLIATPKNNDSNYIKKPSSHWNEIITGMSEGGRNNAATSLVGHLFFKRVDPLLIIELMHLWNDERNNPPLPVDELNTIINSIAGKEFERRQRKNGSFRQC